MTTIPRETPSEGPGATSRAACLSTIAKHVSPEPGFAKRLASYATAAGVGAFGCSQTADAALVHVDLGNTVVHNTPNTFTDLDLDGNGTTDFVFGQTTLRYSGVRMIVYGHPLFEPPEERLPAGELSINFTNTAKGNAYYIRSFELGDTIGPGLSTPTLNNGYPNLTGIMSTNSSNFGDPDDPQFWGFGLNIDGDIHYGWGRVSTVRDGNGDYTVTLHEYAYETTPDVPVTIAAVPEASSLALLAIGGGGLALAARKRQRSELQ
ncbi:MAG: hypothetical protein CMJ58_22900 [Planctomycetaceae bacterium]|nr:hypothetical protein [Planctomycetaceae bacterium]